MNRENAIVIVGIDNYFPLAIRLMNNLFFMCKSSFNIYFLSNENPQDYFVEKHLKRINYITTSKRDTFYDATMKRFEAIEKACKDGYKNIYYIDADTRVGKPFELNEIFDEFIIIDHTHNYTYESKYDLPFDKNINSQAYLDVDLLENPKYYHARFFAGSNEVMLKICKKISEWYAIDKENDVEPIWHDESYLNKFLHTEFEGDIKAILYNTEILIEDKGEPEIISGAYRNPLEQYDLDKLKNDMKLNKDRKFDIIDGSVV